MFNNKTQIRFIKGGFTSPILGNVWLGRIATVNSNTAKNFITMGYAVEHVEGAELEDPNHGKKPTKAQQKQIDDQIEELAQHLKADSFDIEQESDEVPATLTFKNQAGEIIATGALHTLHAEMEKFYSSLTGSSVQPAEFDLANGTTSTLGDIVRQAFTASGLQPDAWNTLDNEDREKLIADVVAGLDLKPEDAPKETAAEKKAREKAEKEAAKKGKK